MPGAFATKIGGVPAAWPEREQMQKKYPFGGIIISPVGITRVERGGRTAWMVRPVSEIKKAGKSKPIASP